MSATERRTRLTEMLACLALVRTTWQQYCATPGGSPEERAAWRAYRRAAHDLNRAEEDFYDV
jgi:hypothetical protein